MSCLSELKALPACCLPPMCSTQVECAVSRSQHSADHCQRAFKISAHMCGFFAAPQIQKMQSRLSAKLYPFLPSSIPPTLLLIQPAPATLRLPLPHTLHCIRHMLHTVHVPYNAGSASTYRKIACKCDGQQAECLVVHHQLHPAVQAVHTTHAQQTQQTDVPACVHAAGEGRAKGGTSLTGSCTQLYRWYTRPMLSRRSRLT